MKFARQDSVVAAGTLALFAASFAVFWPALRGEFLWDDVLNITGNPLVHSPRGLLDIWRGAKPMYDYYPLTWTTWWLEWRAWRRDTLGYHVLNVILHAGAAAMLWRVLVRLAVPGAFAAAMIFAVHPVNVESVAWISERKNTLSMFLLAVTLALYLDSQSADDRRLGRRLYWAAVVAFALALLSKPSVVMLPVVLIVIAWWKRGRVGRADLVATVPFFALSACIAAVTIVFHHGRGISDVAVRTDGFLSRLASAGWVVWFYLYKLVWPAELAFIYPRWEINPRFPLHWLPLVALLAVLAGLFVLRRAIGRGPLMVLACHVLTLAPVLGFVNVYFMRYSFVSDHWQYPASIIVIAGVVAGVTLALRKFTPLRIALAGLVCIGLGALSWREAHAYASNAALWGNAIHDNPRTMVARANYGTTFLGDDHFEQAREQYRIAGELDPAAREPDAFIGFSYIREGKPTDAVPWLRKAVGKRGGGMDPRLLLAQALAATNSNDEAIQWYEQALADDPGAAFRPQLAAIHEMQGHRDRAVDLYREHARVWPGEPEAWFLLASALMRADDEPAAQDALAHARRAARDDATTLHGMGIRLLTAGWPALAVGPLQDATRVQPDLGPAHKNLGKALEAVNRPTEAAAAYQEALRVQPGFREAQELLDNLRAARPQTQPSPAR